MAVVDYSFKEEQMQAILKYQAWLRDTTKREISLAEALVNWIALGYADEYRKIYYPEDN